MSEKVSSKKTVKGQIEIDQSLYSSIRIKAGATDGRFFGLAIGCWDTEKKKKLTSVDTNLWHSGKLVSGQEFLIEGIRLNMLGLNKAQREHVMQYAYFILQIANQDYFTYPCYLMENFFHYMERRLTQPLLLLEYFNFAVVLYMDQSFEHDMDITCELMGKLRRPQ